MTARLRVQRSDTALVVIDVQERLATAMEQGAFDALARNVLRLLGAADRMHLPVALSEQYPTGLGRTVPVVKEAAGRLAPAPVYFEKNAFSVAEEPLFQTFLGSGRKSLLFAGMETHICVYQSVRALCERGFSVHVVADAVLSRTPENKALGLALCERAGAVVTSTETVLFDLLEKAGTDDFKALAKLVK